MKNALSLIPVFVLCLTVAGRANGQATPSHPDFSGTWSLDVEKTSEVQPGRKFYGQQTTIVQDASSLTTISTAGVKFVYLLDGSEVNHHVAQDAPSVVYKSAWQGSRVVTTISSRDNREPLATIETRYLEGQWMVVEMVKKAATGQDVTTKLYFAKAIKK